MKNLHERHIPNSRPLKPLTIEIPEIDESEFSN